MKLKSFCKFLAVLTLFVQFIMIPKESYAATNEGQELVSGGRYRFITALNNNSVLSLGTGGAMLFENQYATNQQWRLDYYSNKQAYKIVTEYVMGHASLAWNPYQSSDDYLVNIGKLDSNDDRYYWIFEDAGNGYYYVKNKGNSRYLDVTGSNTANFTRIIAYNFTGNNNQKFKLQKID